MTIDKFQGKTKEEAIEKAKAQLGQNAVIMNVREVKAKGIFAPFLKSTYEVTAALEEKETYSNPMSALLTNQKKFENINLSADEKIEIPAPVRSESVSPASVLTQSKPLVDPKIFEQEKPKPVAPTAEDYFKETNVQMQKKLDDLSDILEKKLSAVKAEVPEEKSQNSEEMNFIRILYNTLLKNEVDEKYVNQVMDEVDKFIRPGNSVDTILANVYQKLILKFGQPKTIEMTNRKPNIIFFIGPTGVGKTTTIAKIASKYKVESNPKIAFITADTYRIAAAEQLRVYANILDAPMTIVYTVEDLNQAIEKFADYDLIFVDTAGFSHKNEKQREDTKELVNGVSEDYQKEVYLVLSATTKYRDLVDMVDIYHEIADYKLIFTKLDETSCYGNLLNIRLYADTVISYVTNGQNVPDDIEVFDTQKIVKLLLGGK